MNSYICLGSFLLCRDEISTSSGTSQNHLRTLLVKFNQYVFCVKCTIYNYVTLLLCVIILMLCRLGTQLSHIEATEGITIRWTPESDPFQDYLSLKRFKERERLLESMSVTARERWFLLKLKAKFAVMFVHNYDLCMHTCTVSHSDYNYADGQYLASRLSKSITRESTRLKGLVTSYNGLAMESERLSWHDITELARCH